MQASVFQACAPVSLISLIKPPRVSVDASQLSYTPGLGGFQMTSILYRAVLNADMLQCNLPVHSGGWGWTIFGEKSTHISIFWGVRSHLLCAPKHAATLPVSRTPCSLPWRQTLRHPHSHTAGVRLSWGKKDKAPQMICNAASRTSQGRVTRKGTLPAPLSVTTVKALYRQGWLLPGWARISSCVWKIRGFVLYVCKSLNLVSKMLSREGKIGHIYVTVKSCSEGYGSNGRGVNVQG